LEALAARVLRGHAHIRASAEVVLPANGMVFARALRLRVPASKTVCQYRMGKILIICSVLFPVLLGFGRDVIATAQTGTGKAKTTSRPFGAQARRLR
jgi:hypothetical protein